MSERKALWRMKPRWNEQGLVLVRLSRKNSTLVSLSQKHTSLFFPARESRVLLPLQKNKALSHFLTFVVAPFARVEVGRAAVGLPDRLALVDGRAVRS